MLAGTHNALHKGFIATATIISLVIAVIVPEMSMINSERYHLQMDNCGDHTNRDRFDHCWCLRSFEIVVVTIALIVPIMGRGWGSATDDVDDGCAPWS